MMAVLVAVFLSSLLWLMCGHPGLGLEETSSLPNEPSPQITLRFQEGSTKESPDISPTEHCIEEPIADGYSYVYCWLEVSTVGKNQ